MRILEGCILTATNSSDERVKSLIGCKGALHVVNGEPLRFVVGSNENARSFMTATTKRLGVGRQFEMRLYHYDNSNDIVMTQSQYDAVLQRFKEQYKKAYGVAIERGWENSLFDCCENEEEEI